MNTMTNVRRCLAVACALLMAAPVQAWFSTGHMVVAYVAYKRLKGPTRKRVDTLLKLNPQYATWTSGVPDSKKGLVAFVNAATWPDCIKQASMCPGYHADGTNNGETPPSTPDAAQNIGYTDKAMHKYWHYVDKPFAPSGVATHPANIPNAETQMKTLVEALSSGASDDVKSYDVVWIEHISGDVHQPLHAAARFTSVHTDGDAGGNFVRFCDAPCRDNLHSFWDGLIGTSTDFAEIKRIGENLLHKPKPAGSGETSVPVWTAESAALAPTAVYVAPIGNDDNPAIPLSPRPDAAYESRAKALADSQVLLAGYRLAAVLNANLR